MKKIILIAVAIIYISGYSNGQLITKAYFGEHKDGYNIFRNNKGEIMFCYFGDENTCYKLDEAFDLEQLDMANECY